jgi:23S rRNA pseudouridine1911/1915/1917 synthase
MEHVTGEREASDIVIIFENDDYVVINKPAGLMVHEDGRTKGPTVVDWLLRRNPEARGVGEPGKSLEGGLLERSGVVHRLDRETSGALVLVKHEEAFLHMKAQFHDRLIEKEYRAFVYGTMKEKWGSIDRPIGRSVKDFRLRSAEKGARGMLREAVTDWECIGQTESHAYLKLLPKTGRTHQLRVHLKSMSRPIVMDTLYAPEALRTGENLGFTRLALHAYRLSFTDRQGEKQTCIAPLPLDFEVASTMLAMQ